MQYFYSNSDDSIGNSVSRINRLTNELRGARDEIAELRKRNEDMDQELADTGAELASTIMKLNEVSRRLETSENGRKDLIMEVQDLNSQLRKHEIFMNDLWNLMNEQKKK